MLLLLLTGNLPKEHVFSHLQREFHVTMSDADLSEAAANLLSEAEDLPGKM